MSPAVLAALLLHAASWAQQPAEAEEAPATQEPPAARAVQEPPPEPPPHDGPPPEGAPRGPDDPKPPVPPGEQAPPGSPDGSDGAPPDAEGARGPGFVLSVSDAKGALSGKVVKATVGTEGDSVEAKLADDGNPPDPSAGDARWSALVENQPDGDIRVRIIADGEVVAEKLVTVTTEMHQPSVRVFIDETETTWAVEGDGSASKAGGPDKPPPKGKVDASPESEPASPAAASPERAPYFTAVAVLLGLVVGAFAGWWVRGRRATRSLLAPLATPAPLVLPAGTGDLSAGNVIWQVPDHEAASLAMGALLQSRRGRCLAVVIPRPDGKQALSSVAASDPAAFSMNVEEPEVDLIAAAARRLGELGPVVILVQGAGALEPPEANENPAVVLRELFEVIDLRVIVVAVAGEPVPREPDLVLDRVPGGLAVGGRLVVDGASGTLLEPTDLDPPTAP